MPDERRMLDLIGELIGMVELPEFREAILRALPAVVPADWISLNDIGADPASLVVLSEPPPPAELLGDFGALAHENPLVAHYQATRDGRVTRMSDLITRAELHRLALYRRVYRRLGVEYQMAFTLPSAGDRLIGVALSRRDRDFSDAERDLLEAARPFLIQIYRNAMEHDALVSAVRRSLPGRPVDPLAAPGLTERQRQVLGLLATGVSQRDIAARLGLSPRTVEKHLERSYRTLGISSRAEAAAIVWSATA